MPATKAAYYTSTPRQGGGVLDFVTIEDGQRTWGEIASVGGKREARRLAKEKGYTPWNF